MRGGGEVDEKERARVQGEGGRGLRLGGKKFVHPAGIKKIPQKGKEKFEPKTMKI